MTDEKTIELYDFPLSIYCQMVRVALAEKDASYEIKPIDITRRSEQFDRWYLDINPTGVVPSLVVDGEIHIESKNILRHIDEQLLGASLTPAAPDDRARMDEWMKRSDDINYAALLYTMKVTPDGKCPPLLGRLAKLREVRETHPELGEPMDKRIEENLELHPWVASKELQAVQREEIRETLTELDAALEGRTFIAGDTYSLADVMWTASLARFCMQRMAYWADGALPNVARYYAALQARPSWTDGKVFDRMPETLTAKKPPQAATPAP